MWIFTFYEIQYKTYSIKMWINDHQQKTQYCCISSVQPKNNIRNFKPMSQGSCQRETREKWSLWRSLSSPYFELREKSLSFIFNILILPRRFLPTIWKTSRYFLRLKENPTVRPLKWEDSNTYLGSSPCVSLHKISLELVHLVFCAGAQWAWVDLVHCVATQVGS